MTMMESSSYKAGDVRPPVGNLALFPAQMEAIDEVLGQMALTTPASLVLLVDCNGQYISQAGDLQRLDLVALGSLVAGDVAASQQIAHLIGDYDETAVLLREGNSHNMLVSEAGPRMILMMLTSKRVPIGWARLSMQRAVRTLAGIPQLAAINKRHPSHDRGSEPDLGAVISEEIRNLWTE